MKLARLTATTALATALATPFTVSASEWAFDDPYWKEQSSLRTAAGEEPTDPSARFDLFGRPVVSNVTPIDGFGRFDAMRSSWLNANGREPSAQYAQRPAATMTDATETREATREADNGGPQRVEQIEAEKERLNRTGFPQYNP
jgi:hypothetical protein